VKKRISTFIMATSYSEPIFSDVTGPAFQKRDFLKAIRTIQQRQRRYGK